MKHFLERDTSQKGSILTSIQDQQIQLQMFNILSEF